MKKALLLILLSFTMMKLSLAQFPEESNPTFSGVFKGTQANLPDSLLIATYPNILSKNNHTFIVEVDLQGKFNFQIRHRGNNPLYMRIIAYKGGKQSRLGAYFVESSDKIFMEFDEGNILSSLSEKTISFNGDGSDKYNLIEELQQQNRDFLNQRKNLHFSISKDSTALLSALNELNDLVSKFLVKKKHLIAISGVKSPTVKTLLSNEFGLYYGTWLMLHESYLIESKGHENLKEIVRRNFSKYRKDFTIEPNDESVLAPTYIQSLVLGFKIELKISKPNDPITIREYYDKTKNSYEGVIKERLLIEFFTTSQSLINLDSFSQNTYDSLVVDASRYIKNQLYTKLLSDKTKLKKGTKLFDTTFLDLDGKPFNTENLKGKVILIDIWGEGCTGCSLFHKKFEKDVYPFFKDNKDFVVLSISVDKKKEKWLSGINTGKMSSDHYQNVSTGTLATEHPFLKYYNIYAIPFILLVGPDHKTFANLSGSGMSAPADELIRLISEALNTQQN